MSVDIGSDPRHETSHDLREEPGRRHPRLRLALRIVGILLATALMLVLLGLLFSPSYWRF